MTCRSTEDVHIPRMHAIVAGTTVAYVPATIPRILGTHKEDACVPRMCTMVAGTTIVYVLGTFMDDGRAEEAGVAIVLFLGCGCGYLCHCLASCM